MRRLPFFFSSALALYSFRILFFFLLSIGQARARQNHADDQNNAQTMAIHIHSICTRIMLLHIRIECIQNAHVHDVSHCQQNSHHLTALGGIVRRPNGRANGGERCERKILDFTCNDGPKNTTTKIWRIAEHTKHSGSNDRRACVCGLERMCVCLCGS